MAKIQFIEGISRRLQRKHHHWEKQEKKRQQKIREINEYYQKNWITYQGMHFAANVKPSFQEQDINYSNWKNVILH